MWSEIRKSSSTFLQYLHCEKMAGLVPLRQIKQLYLQALFHCYEHVNLLPTFNIVCGLNIYLHIWPSVDAPVAFSYKEHIIRHIKRLSRYDAWRWRRHFVPKTTQNDSCRFEPIHHRVVDGDVETSVKPAQDAGREGQETEGAAQMVVSIVYVSTPIWE